jgi:hypothetical protein
MKTRYSFSVLRYIHDVVTGEFINVGVVLFAPDQRFLSCLCSQRYGRLSKMFLNVDGSHYRQVLEYIQNRIKEEGERLINELPLEKLPESVSGFTSRILPVDDSALQFSPEGYGISDNPSKTLENLYLRHVEQYCEKKEYKRRDEAEIWRVFRRPFEEKQILSKLIPHQIIGKNYEYEFEHCTKNGRWHIQEPISFDLVEANSITDKANIWLGRITSLVDGGESFKLNLLLGAPQEDSLKKAYIKAQNILHTMKCDHELIREDEADDFAELLKKEIEAHEQKEEKSVS